MNTAFSDLEFWLWTMHESLHKKFVDKKSGRTAALKRILQHEVRPALASLSSAASRPVTRFVPQHRRILLDTTASAAEVKGLPASYRAMLRDTYKLGVQLDRASKRSVKSKSALATIESLQSKYKTLLAAVVR